jgi:hypothetical protein
MTTPENELKNRVGDEAVSHLKSYSALANRSATHPFDEERWHTFLISVHKSGGLLPSEVLRTWLVEEGHWMPGQASDLIVRYESGLDLLRAYDWTLRPKE